MSSTKKSGFAIVKVSEFKGKEATPDKNGMVSMYLHPVCGNVPNRNVLSGTVADSQGFEEGKSYLAQWTIGEDDPQYGPQVNWTTVTGEPLSAMETLEAAQSSLFKGEAGTIFEVSSKAVSTPAQEEVVEAKASKAGKVPAQGN